MYFITQLFNLIKIYKINEEKYTMGERLKESTINAPWVDVNQFRVKLNVQKHIAYTWREGRKKNIRFL